MLNSNFLILTMLNEFDSSNNASKIKHAPDTIESLGRFRFEHLDAMRASSLQEIQRKAARSARRKQSGSFFARLNSLFTRARVPA
ncbi:MAG: hypothetical protein V4805_01630 [Pseudomonadota bacterium]